VKRTCSREAKGDETGSETRSLFNYYNLRRLAVLCNAVRIIASPSVSYYNESNLVVGIKKRNHPRISFDVKSHFHPRTCRIPVPINLAITILVDRCYHHRA